MHCETTVDPAGHWRQSWHALERAYAEGEVNNNPATSPRPTSLLLPATVFFLLNC